MEDGCGTQREREPPRAFAEKVNQAKCQMMNWATSFGARRRDAATSISGRRSIGRTPCRQIVIAIQYAKLSAITRIKVSELWLR